MKLFDEVERKISELFDRYIKEDFDIETKLMEEAGYNEEELRSFNANFLSKYFNLR